MFLCLIKLEGDDSLRLILSKNINPIAAVFWLLIKNELRREGYLKHGSSLGRRAFSKRHSAL